MSLFDEGAKQLLDRLHNKDLSSSEVVDESYKRIAAVEDKVKAFLTLNEEAARLRATELDAKGETNKALFGLPIGIKDNIVTKGLRTTCASQLLANFEPLHDATVVDRILGEDGVVIGKLNMDEFAMGSSNENSSFYTTRNPWDLERVPGGSSGGSAAAVAAGMVPFTLGSDTGGSIRQPAAFCGVVGIKPTYGRVSRFGLVAFASSLDVIGPLTRNVEDNAHLLNIIAGVDPYDSTSANVDVPDFTKGLTGDVKGLRIAVPKEYIGEGIDPGIRESVLKALSELEKLGATWEEVSLPHSKYAVATYYLLASSEASANLARFDGVRYGVRAEAENLLDMYKETRSKGFGTEVKRRIMLGTYALSSGYYDAYYKKAQRVRTLIKQDFEKVFDNYDVIIGPTTPTPAFKIGENISDPLTMYANDILTIPMNLSGVPAISVPCGLVNGLPAGLQIIGKAFDEATIYRVAHAYEQAAGWKLVPELEGVKG
ncbi:Asp-tRNA(Asn)/Glu-tRNA(Gln) amidotransferase subunit GatA [Pullulanibacillus sp. KACC 23026]|uniref:Asp-tRNA(Asn)/Glu-tRNA(Gln) amidotransferase subunit GatA n=1 Tax=Pullulanibacillus sp. KACC 23026 TaxID=3028315 RepID=UPI0023B08B7F|nr:Asp-tRNA(Asn)/Glu-tRNA(Gln) amidotransferase subunit GatA [Pullulanibacillus sp. KACC 23026]WEG12377.1 Asp-tRNA(Asn)/Glu-tRNA(Gln) amidotransferase subunit GatA [Pullulanibacillus sp. KACC 23026]